MPRFKILFKIYKMGAVRAVGADCTLGPPGPSDGLILLLAQQAYKTAAT